MIAIVDYGVGNLFSLQSSLHRIGADAVVTGDEKVIRGAERIILPGVGAFGDAAEKLRATGLGEVVADEAGNGKCVLGICLGMQLLFEESSEFGLHRGLGLIKGRVVDMASLIPPELKVPHIGWNSLHLVSPHPLMKYVREGDYVYFVHSYFAADCGESVVATTEYGITMTAAAASGSVCGCQFHPEKSGRVGLGILKAFCEMQVNA